MNISASLDCANYMSLKNDIEVLENAKIDSLHIDIIDGIFAPNFGVSAGILKQLSNVTSLPIEVHLMVEDPIKTLDLVCLPHVDTITFHIEAVTRPYQLINQIKDRGKKVGVAINPTTPLEFIENLTFYIDTLMIMSVDPGFPGQKFIPETLNKINRLSRLEMPENLDIQVDGAIGYKEISILEDTIVSTIIAGTSALFKEGEPLEDSVKKLIEKCKVGLVY